MATTTTAISQEAWRFPGLLASPGRDSSALLEVPESLADRLEHDLVVDPTVLIRLRVSARFPGARTPASAIRSYSCRVQRRTCSGLIVPRRYYSPDLSPGVSGVPCQPEEALGRDRQLPVTPTSPGVSDFGQATPEVAANALVGGEKVGHGFVGRVQVPGLALGIVRIQVGDPVPDGDEHAEGCGRRERAEAVHQLCHLPSGQTPDVLAPDDRDHLEQLVLDGIDELLEALEEGVEVILDLGRQRAHRGGRQRESSRQLSLRTGQAPGTAFGGAKGLTGQRRFLGAHKRMPSRSAIRSSGVKTAPRSWRTMSVRRSWTAGAIRSRSRCSLTIEA